MFYNKCAYGMTQIVECSAMCELSLYDQNPRLIQQHLLTELLHKKSPHSSEQTQLTKCACFRE